MSSKTKIVVVKLKDLLFYATVLILCVIVLLMLYILFQPDSSTTNSTISVKTESLHTDSLFQLSYSSVSSAYRSFK